MTDADLDDDLDLGGVEFTKVHVLKALDLGSSQVSTDAKYFSRDVLEASPEIADWYENPDGKDGKRFNRMSITAYKEYVAKATAKRVRKRRREESESSSESESDSSEDEKSKGKSKSKGKAKASGSSSSHRRSKKNRKSDAIDSDELDE